MLQQPTSYLGAIQRDIVMSECTRNKNQQQQHVTGDFSTTNNSQQQHDDQEGIRSSVHMDTERIEESEVRLKQVIGNRVQAMEEGEEDNNIIMLQVYKDARLTPGTHAKGKRDFKCYTNITSIFHSFDRTISRTRSNTEITILVDSDQQLTTQLTMLDGGDFNVVLHEEEKIDGLLVYPQEYEDFVFCINSCELFDIRYKRSPFNWWSGRASGDCIFKRIGKVFMTQMRLCLFLNVEVEHLARTGSDHAPLLLTCGGPMSLVARPFKFLKFWTEAADFERGGKRKFEGG
ncbi:hypothetical protein KY285_030294 [Solanum tuberosum]|nr:hypothetical protein KY285_030294 [Solanum tuberosum]